MSPQPHGVITAEQRDRAADERDEAAWRRDRASAVRDSEAAERDERAETRRLSAVQYARLTRRLLGAAGQQVETDQNVIRGLLRHLDEALEDAEVDRLAASRDRLAAAADRRQAAEDRITNAAHREQAAIEREQHAPESVLASQGARGDLYARALTARAQSEAICEARH